MASMSAASRHQRPDAFLLRRALPAVLLLSLGVGWLRWLATQKGLISDTAGVAVMTAFSALTFTVLAVWAARTLRAAARSQQRFEHAELYRAVARNYPGGALFLFDRELRYLLVDGGGLADVGLVSQELEGRTIWEALEPEAAAMIEPAYRAALAGATSTAEMPFRSETYRVTIAPTRGDDGSVSGGIVLTQNISDQKRLEEQLAHAQKMDAVGRLAGGVAHDFNNLLQVISGYTNMLLLDPNAAPELAEIGAATDRAESLTRQLLAFSRKQVLHPIVFDLNETLAEIDPLLRRVLGEDILVSVSSSSEPAVVEADPGELERVILNLAINARDAMPDGGNLALETTIVEIDDNFVSTHLEGTLGPNVLLAVSDTGHGMTAEVQSRLFEPFFTTKQAGAGTGLGLASVFGVVKQSGGSIWVYSEEGVGSTFKIYLPLASRTPATAAPREPAPPAVGGTETILVVEDEPQVRELVRAMLESQGYRVITAADPEAAAAACDETTAAEVDMLLTDVVLPGTTGREVAERFRQLNPDVRVLFMSGYSDEAVQRRGAISPDSAFIEKPFTLAGLSESVRSLLDG
jgi:two-component system cell cycle sensor histidine kinase/response regulator CckA